MEAPENTTTTIPITVTNNFVSVSIHTMNNINGGVEVQANFRTNSTVYIKAIEGISGTTTPSTYTSSIVIIGN